mmetsp:Transcript_36381/g.89533  ORF Transcript_36381/g.89533 Transcript_36381/m.89533 type:complete len:202 (-) Transcript_36381:2087-2692(-)
MPALLCRISSSALACSFSRASRASFSAQSCSMSREFSASATSLASFCSRIRSTSAARSWAVRCASSAAALAALSSFEREMSFSCHFLWSSLRDPSVSSSTVSFLATSRFAAVSFAISEPYSFDLALKSSRVALRFRSSSSCAAARFSCCALALFMRSSISFRSFSLRWKLSTSRFISDSALTCSVSSSFWFSFSFSRSSRA